MKVTIPLQFEIDDKQVRLAIDKYVSENPNLAEVVRCKECDQWKRNLGFTDSPNGHCFYHCIDTNGYDFCSYGERKDK